MSSQVTLFPFDFLSSLICLDNPIYKATSKDLREILKEELLYIASHGDATPFHLIGHLYLAIDALIRSTSIMQTSKISRLQDFYIHEALSYIEQNFQNDISVENIAAVCGLNRSYFGKIFKDGIGKSPQEFLLNYRIKRFLYIIFFIICWHNN